MCYNKEERKSRIKYLEDECIAIYIYGEATEKHHGKHLLILKADEGCQYGFDGRPIKGSKALKNRNDRKVLRRWILSHQDDLEEAWDDINNGRKPKFITD